MNGSENLVERIANLLLDDETSDVTLVVEGGCLPAHRVIVSTSCEYFRALLQGNMRESLQSEIVLKDIPLRGFKLFLSFLYSGRLSLKELDEETIIEVLGIACQYCNKTLETMICLHLQDNLSIENVFTIYGAAHRRLLNDLRNACINFMNEDPYAILENEAFYDHSEAAFFGVISLDTFCADEIDIFKAVYRWLTRNPAQRDLSNLLGDVRLPLIDSKLLVTTVNGSGLVCEKLILDAIRTKECHAMNMNFRGLPEKGVNLASPEYGVMRLIKKTQENYEPAGGLSDYDGKPLHLNLFGYFSVRRPECLLIALENRTA